MQTYRRQTPTGYARPDDWQQALEAGFDEHLAKPADLEMLMRGLASTPVTQRPSPSWPGTGAATAKFRRFHNVRGRCTLVAACVRLERSLTSLTLPVIRLPGASFLEVG